MKGLFLASVFVSSWIIAFSPSIVQSAELNAPICLKTTSSNKEIAFKEQCTQLRTVLKDILGEYEKIMSSKRLTQTTERTKIRNTVWYYTPNSREFFPGPMLSTDSDKISVSRMSRDKQLCVHFDEDVMTCIALHPSAPFFHKYPVPLESVKITGESPKKILVRLQNLQIRLQKLRNELRKPS
jgi:hypothetical protein